MRRPTTDRDPNSTKPDAFPYDNDAGVSGVQLVQTPAETGNARYADPFSPSDPPASPAFARVSELATDQLDWMRLWDALNIISANATGLTETENKLVVCRWISNHRVDARLTLPSGEVLDGVDIYVPPHLQVGALDWKQSRPLKPWLAGFGAARRHVRDRVSQSLEGGGRDIMLIELKADQLRNAIDESSPSLRRETRLAHS